MLVVPQIAHLQAKDPQLYEGLKQIIAGINHGFTQLGVDPHPSAQTQAVALQPGQERVLPSPVPPLALETTVLAPGVITFHITPPVNAPVGLRYFLEVADNADFTVNARVFPLGESTTGSLGWGSAVTKFHRCWTALPKSQASVIVPAPGPVTTL